MIDAGIRTNQEPLPQRNLHELIEEGHPLFPSLIGDKYEALHNLDHTPLSPKLKGPLMRFITEKPQHFSHDDLHQFEAVMSFAAGGLANAWGAGVLRFHDRELEGFPYTARDLDPYYDTLTEHIGIGGVDDDLREHLGSTAHLLPPLPLSPLSAELMKLYRWRRPLFERYAVRIGRMRYAILSREHNKRPAYQFHGQDFFQPNNRSIYHPGYTLDALIAERHIDYQPGLIVTRYEEREGYIEVTAESIEENLSKKFRCRKLLIAAGALNSARLVLSTNSDFSTRLPLLDNPVSFVPFIIPWRIGRAFNKNTFAGGELLITYPGGPAYSDLIQGSFYNLNAPLRSDILSEFPLSLKGNITAAKYLLPALAMIQVFYPDRPHPENYLQLKQDGGLLLRYRAPPRGSFERYLMKLFAQIGYLSLPFLCKYPNPGSSIHYAGGLPMVEHPTQRYQTDPVGRLYGTQNIHIVDAATFPHLPAKNLTFTIMANAMRIAATLR